MHRRDLWQELCSYENLFLAYKKARKHKTTKDCVIEFEKNLKSNLLLLRSELLLHSYAPKLLVNFTIRDPKTRKISKSDFRDRVIHHALCNIIEPMFEKTFIHDSYANRKGKGTLKAVERFDCFKKKASRNNTIRCYVLKADIRKYFESINHGILMNIIKKKINDKRVIWLIKKILGNCEGGRCQSGSTNQRFAGLSSQVQKGMPLGNLTSQFFANVYLNELDYYVKHELKIKYYLRYVDDFIILHHDKNLLRIYKNKINNFLKKELDIGLHPDKSKIILLKKGISFLGFRIFFYHKLLKKSNMKKMKIKFNELKDSYDRKKTDYDYIYDFLEGWLTYAKNADTHKLRKRMIKEIEEKFSNEVSTKEINRIAKNL